MYFVAADDALFQPHEKSPDYVVHIESKLFVIPEAFKTYNI